jgi:arginase family enzyme
MYMKVADERLTLTKMQADIAYTACMTGIQYTVRGVSRELDAELRREARASGRSLNTVVVEALEHAKLPGAHVHDDLDWFIGSVAPGTGADEAAALTWLDSLPADLS